MTRRVQNLHLIVISVLSHQPRSFPDQLRLTVARSVIHLGFMDNALCAVMPSPFLMIPHIIATQNLIRLAPNGTESDMCVRKMYRMPPISSRRLASVGVKRGQSTKTLPPGLLMTYDVAANVFSAAKPQQKMSVECSKDKGNVVCMSSSSPFSSLFT